MTAIGDLVTMLAAHGLPADKIADAVDLAQRHALEMRPQNSADIPLDISAERRRAKDRERKRLNRVSADIPRNSADNPRMSQNDYISSSPPDLEDSEKKEKKIATRKIGRGISADWKPNDRHYAAGLERGFDKRAVDDMAEDMRLWAKSNEHRAVARKSNWDLTFAAWIRRQGTRKPSGGPENGNTSPIRAHLERRISDISGKPGTGGVRDAAGADPPGIVLEGSAA